jgi:riboflavin kinase/FMN adenylyltransferase
MGRNREGDANALRALGKEMGFSVTAVPPVKINGEVVSSTAIRNALAKGDMEKVHRLTGRFFSLHGRVIAGDGRGAKLGFPTANLDIVDPQHAIPADGIYATRAYIEVRTYKSVTNIGTRPTFDGGNRTVEVYIIDFKGNLYGQDLKIDILKRLRKEKRFASVEELKKQMAEDVKQSIVVLDSQEKN